MAAKTASYLVFGFSIPFIAAVYQLYVLFLEFETFAVPSALS
jgi:hypothetical protein